MMSADSPNPYAVNSTGPLAASAVESERIGFIRRTYAHLTGAVLALIAIEAVLFNVVPDQTMQSIVGRMMSGWNMFIVFGAFMVASWVARSWASNATSSAMQYTGLGLYVVAWAVFMLPMLYICVRVLGEPALPVKAAAITAMCFMGLTAYVFMSRVDLAGWGKFLMMAGFAALGVILTGMLFGFSLGLWFSGLMVALMCGYILYDTSNILHHYHTSQHVAASLALFADVVMLFWYVLQIMMRFSSND
jgi:FtsH-binding integral membrane protein